MCSKIIKLQEQLYNKINECKKLQLDVLRWKEREETYEYDLITLNTQVHDFSDDSAERTPAAKYATQPEILEICEEEEAVAARAEVQSARESSLHERVEELEAANKSLREYSERMERRAQKMGETNLRVEIDEAFLQRDDALTMLHKLMLHLEQLSNTRNMHAPLNPYARQQQQQVAHQEAQRKATLEQQQK